MIFLIINHMNNFYCFRFKEVLCNIVFADDGTPGTPDFESNDETSSSESESGNESDHGADSEDDASQEESDIDDNLNGGKDETYLVMPLIEAFNHHRARKISPSRVLVIDESMSRLCCQWYRCYVVCRAAAWKVNDADEGIRRAKSSDSVDTEVEPSISRLEQDYLR
eukprot:m.154477 g.154477  ORF g.154477 m.154477 type:complete len:167 (-) comp16257_c0_seq8:1408-1908(-)